MKFIIIAILIIYALVRFSGFLLRILAAGQQRQSSQGHYQQEQPHVDRNPSAGKKSFDGGEYIDYEEVK